MDKKNIKDDGKRKGRFHQWLSDFRADQLKTQIWRVIGAMEVSRTLANFKENAKRISGLSMLQARLFDEPDHD